MDFGGKLEELNLTRDEMSRLGEALKDEQFRELLREYAAEISSPENRRRREEEIAQLEEQRGVRARFLHPEPHHVLKTRGARGKLFINICSDPLIDKPSSETARDRDGTPGHRWRLPFSLTPGTPDRDAAGNSCVTHDVIFHPDALHLAGNSRRFMKMLHSTAIEGIEDSFHVKLEKHNIKQLKMKYKGVPQAALIRRPIPGHQQNTCETLLSFPDPGQTQREQEPEPDQTQTEPEPDQDQTHTEPEPDQTHTEQEPEPDQTQTEPDQTHTEQEPDPDQTHTEPEPDQTHTEQEPEPDQIQTEPEPDPDQTQTEPEPVPDQTHTEPDSRPSSHQPTAPQYSVKYRSVVDLQDYRSSRDSGPGTRPTEIVVTVDLPLLGSAGDAELSVKQRRLVLESQNPAYKLDLPLSYPVDEDKGHAKFNKTKQQLTVTLPVRPARSAAVQQLRRDEMKPSASEPQITALTTEPQTLSDPAVKRTEPQEPDHRICSVETDKDETNINQPVDRSSNTFSSASKITANGADEASGAPETENTQESESNTARHALLPQQPSHEEDLSSSQDTEETKTRRSSEDKSTAERFLEEDVLREIKPDGGDVFICTHETSAALCFQNCLWSALD